MKYKIKTTFLLLSTIFLLISPFPTFARELPEPEPSPPAPTPIPMSVCFEIPVVLDLSANLRFHCDVVNQRGYVTAEVGTVGGAQGYISLSGTFTAPKSDIAIFDAHLFLAGVLDIFGYYGGAEVRISWSIGDATSNTALVPKTSIYHESISALSVFGVPIPFSKFIHGENIYVNAGKDLIAGHVYRVAFEIFAGAGMLAGFVARSAFYLADSNYLEVISSTYRY